MNERIFAANYRGSAGYGEGNINNLLGKVGVQDVQDTLVGWLSGWLVVWLVDWLVGWLVV